MRQKTIISVNKTTETQKAINKNDRKRIGSFQTDQRTGTRPQTKELELKDKEKELKHEQAHRRAMEILIELANEHYNIDIRKTLAPSSEKAS
ncbi:MAG: hypothetical protein ACLRS8_07975 [Parabacteroides merdae]